MSNLLSSHKIALQRIGAFLCALCVFFPYASSAYAVVGVNDQVNGKVYSDYHIKSSLMPDVSMDEGILVTKDGRVLWSREATTRHHIASITKVMTAIVAIENAKPTDIMTVPEVSTEVGESSASLKRGEKMPLKDLLGALLVKSGNDAALAIAINIGGDVDTFVEMMNKKAKELGMTNTHFDNPHGLDSDTHYSCARDVSIMSRYALQNKTIREIVSSKLYKFSDATNSHKLPNTNLLLWKYQGAIGTKTGWTDKAGYCLSAAANRDGVELYAITLGTSTELARFSESIKLLDFGYDHYRKQEIAVAGSQIGSAKVKDYPNKYVPGVVERDVTIHVLDFAGDITRVVKTSTVKAPIKKGDTIGVVQFIQDKKMIASVPLVAKEDVHKPFILLQPIFWIIQVVRSAFH